MGKETRISGWTLRESDEYASIPLKFKCPKCNEDKLRAVESDAVLFHDVVLNGKNKTFYYANTEIKDDVKPEHIHYECKKCRYVLENEDGRVIDRNEEELFSWIKENCRQVTNT